MELQGNDDRLNARIAADRRESGDADGLNFARGIGTMLGITLFVGILVLTAWMMFLRG